MTDNIGIVGSPSTTMKACVDILEDATGSSLQGQLVYFSHPLDAGYLFALGTVTDIETSNRWHEDANMRGVLKHYGSLPHLSGVGDVRTAEVLVQAAYLSKTPDLSGEVPPIESGGTLAMSPTTGACVARVTDDFLTQLLRRHKDEIVYLGNLYRTEVKLPLTLRHFGPADQGGAGEAYHSGIFGMTGSGKSVFAAYLLAALTRHPSLGVFIMDPQGQFASEEGLPFSLQEWAEQLGRDVQVYAISSDLRLPKDAYLLGDLLGLTRFFSDLLTIKAQENRDSAVAEFTRILQNCENWESADPDNVLRAVLSNLLSDQQALQRIYSSPQSRARLSGALDSMLSDPSQFVLASDCFRPLHSLFTPINMSGGTRHSLWSVIQNALSPTADKRPLVIIDFSATGDSSAASENSTQRLLESTPVKARILRLVCSILNRNAEQLYKQGGNLNTLVVFDEAQRFASESPEDDESAELAVRLVDYVRTTRKYGLGWTFITQEIGSLRRGIYSQLRVRCFGYGLTSGTELQRLRETVGDPSSLDLYRTFVDPAAIRPSTYPFMLMGPISPLSFTGAPVFLSVYTDFEKFKRDNGFHS
ncbi:ATP-binding protein [Chloroflexota bacterium]